jgi:hypothetical protein
MHLRQLKRHTGALLAELGDSPDDVADALQGAGVLGIPASNRRCAVALYLGAVMGSDPRVRSLAVGPCSLVINLVRPEDLRPAGRLQVQLPKPVRQFVAAFDAHRYPMVVRDLPPAPVDVPSFSWAGPDGCGTVDRAPVGS